MSDNQLAEGVYGYDVGQVPPQPVLITNADKGKVKNLKPALKELVLDTPGNQAYRVTEESDTVGIQYLEIDGNAGKEYTMPAERIATPSSQITFGEESADIYPHEYTMYLALRELFSYIAREDQEVLASVVEMAASSELPDVVVSRAREDVSDLLDL